MSESRLKNWLDWAQHGYWIGTVLASLGLGRGLMTWIAKHVNIAPDWRGVIWLVFSGLFFWLFAFIGATWRKWRREAPEQTEPAQTQISKITITASPPAIEDFYRTYDGELLKEVEAGLRTTVEKYPSGERENFLVRLISAGIVGYWFDLDWAYIFKSQVLALQELNTRDLKREGLLAYYDKAVAQYPVPYANYSFEQWLGWLRTNVLIREDGDLIKITIRGKEFLKNMVHLRRSPDTKHL